MIRRAPDVDVSAVRARIRETAHETGISARLLARVFGLPKSTVYRVVRAAPRK
jgi:DNA-binding IclR family transcriptional regulator